MIDHSSLGDLRITTEKVEAVKQWYLVVITRPTYNIFGYFLANNINEAKDMLSNEIGCSTLRE